MKGIIKLLMMILLLTNGQSKAQNPINSDNYYSFFKDYEFYKKNNLKHLSCGRIDELEAAPILYNEMKLAGFEGLSIFKIIDLGDNNYITAICYSEKSKFGFVFDGSFNMIPEKKIRDLERHSKNAADCEYDEKIVSLDGTSRFVKIDRLPENLYLIRSDIYWHQRTENEEINKTLVTYDVMKQIFRDDIKKILKSVKRD
jgi:hypothetical protein